MNDNGLNLEMRVSNKVYKLRVDREVNIVDFAKRHRNCVLLSTCPWRLTMHSKLWSVNVFRAGTWIFMTRELEDQFVSDTIKNEFGLVPENVSVVNITAIVKHSIPIDLEDLYDFFVNNPAFRKGARLFLDKQKFPALIVKRTVRSANVVFEFYIGGSINVTGMNENAQLTEAVQAIREILEEYRKSISTSY
jgi:hypothetical protein